MAQAPIVAAGSRAINPIIVFPAAITAAAFIEKAFAVGGEIARLCVRWTDFARELWSRLFAFLPDGASIHTSDRLLDLLTLWVTCSLVVALMPHLSGERGHVPKSTIAAVHDLTKLPPLLTQIVALALIVGSLALIVAVFREPIQAAGESNILLPGGDATRSWLAGSGLWFAGVVGAVAVSVLGYLYFVHNPKVAAMELTATEQRDISVVSVALWVFSAAALVAAFLTPLAGWTLAGLRIAQVDCMLLSLIGLAALVMWRSALPFVQLALLVLAILAIDRIYTFLSEIWRATM